MYIVYSMTLGYYNFTLDEFDGSKVITSDHKTPYRSVAQEIASDYKALLIKLND